MIGIEEDMRMRLCKRRLEIGFRSTIVIVASKTPAICGVSAVALVSRTRVLHKPRGSMVGRHDVRFDRCNR
jgi:hypothetical protein